MRREEEEPPAELRQVLILLAWEREGSEPVRLMTRRMSPRTVHFSTLGWLPTDAPLRLRILLPGGGSVEAEGVVVALHSRVEGAVGRLEMACGDEKSLSLLRACLQRLAVHR
jgi:hypothetical protein